MTFVIPAFIAKTALGLVVDPIKFKNELSQQPTAFHLFLDQFFASSMRFYGLDYAVLSALLVTPEKYFSQFSPIRLAADAVDFPEYRQDLYKGVRLLDDNFKAEYIFQPMVVETPFKQPLYGDKQRDGTTPIVGYENRIRQEDAVLDVDEFIAAMWSKGIRCGLQMDLIEPSLFAKKTVRMVIAQGYSPTPGKNAEVIDVFTPAKQLNGPVWINGQLDLRHFQNKYPGVTKGRAILQKIPAQPGGAGFTVTSERLEPEAVLDLDLSQFTGPGTRIEMTADGEVLCADIDGYISWSSESKKISISEQIESQVDINVKNTGDVALQADQFTSHGEVQEARLVKGKNMRFTAPVYGNLLSDGGHILVESILSSGSAVVTGEGSIVISQKVINARIVAISGKINLNYAENSLIMGDEVTLGQAINCVVVANTLHIATAKACLMAAKSVDVDSASEHKNVITKLIVFKPDLTTDFAKLNALTTDLQGIQTLMNLRRDELAAIKKNPQFARYLQLHATLKGDPEQITQAIKEEFVLLQRSQAANLKTIERLVKDLQKCNSASTEKAAHIQMQKDEINKICLPYHCTLKAVSGDVAAHAVNAAFNGSTLAEKSLKDVGQWLQSIAAEGESIVSEQDKPLHWQFSIG